MSSTDETTGSGKPALEQTQRVPVHTVDDSACHRPEMTYSCGMASGWSGIAEATGPGPAPSR
jgi:hypothetical protein